MSFMQKWGSLVWAFRMSKISWNDEPRKHLLSESEIEDIDKAFFELSAIIDTFDFRHRHQHFANFSEKVRLLHILIANAERKMGYVTFSDL